MRFTRKKIIGFSFAEIMITLSLFMVMASVGVGAYFSYYDYSLVNNDFKKVSKILYETRFKAMKNPYNSNYGVFLDFGNQGMVIFRDTYTPSNSENEIIEFEKITMKELGIMPNIGLSKSIVFENRTGKTQNYGYFTVGKETSTRTFNINIQGAFE